VASPTRDKIPYFIRMSLNELTHINYGLPARIKAVTYYRRAR